MVQTCDARTHCAPAVYMPFFMDQPLSSPIGDCRAAVGFVIELVCVVNRQNLSRCQCQNTTEKKEELPTSLMCDELRISRAHVTAHREVDAPIYA